MIIKTHPNDEILNLKCVVYQIKNDTTGDCYVGITKGVLRLRIKNHIGCHSNSILSGSYNRTGLYKDFKKYGLRNFTIKILSICKSKKQLLSVEKIYQSIDVYKKYNEKNKLKITSTRKNKGKIICLIDLDGVKQYFNNQSEVSKKYNVSRYSIGKAIKDKYKFKRRFIAMYVNKSEAYINQLTINL